jgi:MoaA/NifB/PqqE/SkfB family radical SAM enzyme/GT2 family glycosyltransferase
LRVFALLEVVNIFATIVVGERCNNDCAVCRFMEKKCPPKEPSSVELELQRLRKEVYTKVLLTGGEVLLREDISEIIRLVRAYGFEVWIESNGRLLADEAHAAELKKIGIKGFMIQFFSHEPTVQNISAGSKDSFKESVRGIKTILEQGFECIVKLVVTRQNFTRLKGSVEFLKTLGVEKVQIFFPESLPEEYAELEEIVPEIPEASPHINLALARLEELGMEFVPRFTPFSLKALGSKWVKLGRKTGSPESHALLFDNRVNVNEKPIVSVIIPTFNRSKILQNTLVSLFNQTFKGFEVIVVDDGSTDETFDMVKGLNPPFRLRYFIQDDRGYGPGRARNIGTIYAEGEIMLYLDSDVICDPRNLEEHVKVHAKYKRMYNHDVLVIGKRLDMHTTTAIHKQLTPETILNDFDAVRRIPARPDLREDFFKWCNDDPSSFHAPWHMIFTNNISVKRRHMLSTGLIDESFVFWSIEDQELGYRLQWLRFVLNSDAVGYHQHHPVVYGSKEGMDKAFKYNARIFYKKFLNPKIFEVYKPWLHQHRCTVQINDGTLNEGVFFRFIGRKPGVEKSLEEITKELLLYQGEGDDELELIGGNPLLHPNIMEVLKFAKPLFEWIELDTEAESLEKLKTCIELVQSGVKGFKLNLGGSIPEHHDIIVNRKGSFERTIKAIKNVLLVNASLTVRVIISRQNYPHITDTIKMLEHMGVKNIELHLPLSNDPNEYLFDEPTLPLSGLLYYHLMRGLKLAESKGISISTVNIFSEFLGLNINVMQRMYELFGRPVAISRGRLR